jgi:predicted nuclease of restriction endonuclease-like (RecB) superfamily
MADLIYTSKGYQDLLARLKNQIRTAQVRAALAVNHELVLLYWQIGKDILTRQKEEGWGAKVIDQLSRDLHLAFPSMHGFSPRNLKYMRTFAEAWPDESIVQQAVAQLPWGHNVRLLDYVKDSQERLWYIEQAIRNGWSRNVLVIQIESGLYKRQGTATTNFQSTLPAPESDLAQQLLKDPYNFDFLTLAKEAQERDLEGGLLVHLRQFLIELGTGFAFVGSQVPLEVGGEDFKLDLLFYHLKLRCFVQLSLLGFGASIGQPHGGGIFRPTRCGGAIVDDPCSQERRPKSRIQGRHSPVSVRSRVNRNRRAHCLQSVLVTRCAVGAGRGSIEYRIQRGWLRGSLSTGPSAIGQHLTRNTWAARNLSKSVQKTCKRADPRARLRIALKDAALSGLPFDHRSPFAIP